MDGKKKREKKKKKKRVLNRGEMEERRRKLGQTELRRAGMIYSFRLDKEEERLGKKKGTLTASVQSNMAFFGFSLFIPIYWTRVVCGPCNIGKGVFVFVCVCVCVCGEREKGSREGVVKYIWGNRSKSVRERCRGQKGLDIIDGQARGIKTRTRTTDRKINSERKKQKKKKKNTRYVARRAVIKNRGGNENEQIGEKAYRTSGRHKGAEDEVQKGKLPPVPNLPKVF